MFNKQEEETEQDFNNQTNFPNLTPNNPNNDVYQRVIQEERVNNFIGQTSPGKTLTKIDWMLKGFLYDEVEKKWKKISHGIPDDIRLDFLQALSPHLTEDVRMTRLDKNQINGIMEFIIEWTIDYLDIVADDYYFSTDNNKFEKFKPLGSKDREKYKFNVAKGLWEDPVIREDDNLYSPKLSEEQLTKIALILWSAIFYVLARAENGIERDKVYNSLKLGDDFSSYANPPAQKSVMESILPWK